jgi:hypothetical protein|tara:strand:- start:349 stop:618 length:270 start_codon:yes stop_codon:yes gene_type:complete
MIPTGSKTSSNQSAPSPLVCVVYQLGISLFPFYNRVNAHIQQPGRDIRNLDFGGLSQKYASSSVLTESEYKHGEGDLASAMVVASYILN